jgi:hypothetical protein
VQVVLLSLPVMSRVVTNEMFRLDGWTPYWEPPYALIAFEDGILRQVVALVLSSISLPHLLVIFRCKTLCIKI